MNQIGILYTAPMPAAIISGRKTKTRRIITWPTVPDWHDWDYEPNIVVRKKSDLNGWWPEYNHRNAVKDIQGLLKCPYGQPGDLLYVRESYYQYGEWKYTDLLTKGGKVKSEFVPLDEEIVFEPSLSVAGKTFHLELEPNSYRLPAWYKRLGRFMPKKYARIWLKMTDIKVERLQDITEEEAIAEGIEPLLASRTQLAMHGRLYRDYLKPAELFNDGLSAIESFKSLWVSINGQESWDENPWVWVVSFEVLSTTGKPSL